MRYPLHAAAVAAGLLAVAACSGTAALRALPARTTPQTGTSRYQAGIDLDFYWHPGMNASAGILADASYARGLGANAVMISFPFYANEKTAFAGPATPPPGVLADAIMTARAEGLSVGVRPLLDEKSLGHSREKLLPADAGAWLASYAALIVPYARAAWQAGASRFWTGTELTDIGHAAGWAKVTAAVRGVFRGQLYYAANWVSGEDTERLSGSGGPGVSPTADAYQGMPVAISAFAEDWKAKAAALPPGTVLSEVGIAARWGAQWKPYVWAPSDAPLDPQLQAAWFAAACGAVQADRLGGIYFWAVNVGQSLDTPPTPQTANQFTDSAGAAAIRACFAELGGA